jgi:pimeloyl-ACP methyl ester carboxylesterase
MPLAMRMSQMRTVDEEAAMLLGAAKTLCQLYGKLSVPVRLIAGSHDRIVDTDQHSLRLHLDLASSTLTRLPGVGHMVHHAAPKEVLEAITAVGALRGGRGGQQATDAEDQRPTRQWLHIGGDLVAA